MTMTNIAIRVHSKKGTKLKNLKDFLPKWDGQKEETPIQTAEDFLARWKSFAEIQNKKQ